MALSRTVLARVSRRLDAERADWNAGLSALGRKKRWETALSTAEEMRRRGISWDQFTCSALISGCSAGAAVDAALKLLEDMPRRDVEVNTFVLGAAANACVRRQLWRKGLELLRSLPRRGLQPSTVTYGTAINACAAAALWEESLEFLRRVASERLAPSVILLNSAMRSCERGGRWQQALQLLDVGFGERQLRPDEVSRERDHSQVPRALIGLKQNLHASTAAIVACAGSQWPRALQLLRRMRGALRVGRGCGLWAAQLKQLTKQAAYEQQTLQGDIEALRQAAFNAQQDAAQHRARVHAACQELGARSLGANALRHELWQLRAQGAQAARGLAQQRGLLAQEAQRAKELRSQVSEEGLALRRSCAEAEQRLRHEEQVSSLLGRQLTAALRERDAEAQAAQEFAAREQAKLRRGLRVSARPGGAFKAGRGARGPAEAGGEHQVHPRGGNAAAASGPHHTSLRPARLRSRRSATVSESGEGASKRQFPSSWTSSWTWAAAVGRGRLRIHFLHFSDST
ncbi:unnamed protein product [Effrenium voratum]|nr:unnamed protein product [Effrenium voratum]